jgi:hypothetical protein
MTTITEELGRKPRGFDRPAIELTALVNTRLNLPTSLGAAGILVFVIPDSLPQTLFLKAK